MLLGLLSPQEVIKEKVFHGEGNGICLIHGDTLSTLFSLLYARRCGIPVAHVEAGLRSFRLFDPFPEELIRLVVMRYSDILFAPSDWAMGNLSRMGYRNKSINIRGNTIVDTIRFARARFSGKDRPGESYVVVTIHRVETLYSSARMNMVVTFVEEIARQRRVLFILHEPTRKRLAKARPSRPPAEKQPDRDDAPSALSEIPGPPGRSGFCRHRRGQHSGGMLQPQHPLPHHACEDGTDGGSGRECRARRIFPGTTRLFPAVPPGSQATGD